MSQQQVILLLPSATKVIFSQASVSIVHRGRGVPQCTPGHTPPEAHSPPGSTPPQKHNPGSTPPGEAHTPRKQTPQKHTPGSTPPPRRSLPWTVRILMECFLVWTRTLLVYCFKTAPLLSNDTIILTGADTDLF